MSRNFDNIVDGVDTQVGIFLCKAKSFKTCAALKPWLQLHDYNIGLTKKRAN
jgi:hypothetical protein